MTRAGEPLINVIPKDIFAALRAKKFKKPNIKEEFLKTDKPSRLLKRWNEFLSVVATENGAPEVMTMVDLMEAPDFDYIQAFFSWMVRTKPGQSDRRRCIGTLRREFDMLARILELQTNYKFPKEDREAFKRHIKGLAETEGASWFADPKGLASFVVVDDVINYLWTCDEHIFRHPRERLQLSFAILVLGSLGLRPGELVQSNLYLGSNDGLKYKDCALQVDRNGTFSLLLTRRLMKKKRNELDKAQEHTIFEIPEKRMHCPLTIFVALAVADGALDMKQLAVRNVEAGANAKIIPMRKELLEVPVLRATKDQSEISSDAILRYNSLEYMLIKLGQRAGYKEPLSAYTFRRGVGNALDKNVTSAERQRIMGHSNERMFQVYMSKVCPIDSQGITQGTEQRMEEIEFLRSMSFHRNLNAPMPHTASLTRSGKRSNGACSSKEDYERERYVKRQKFRQERAEFFQNPHAVQSKSSSEPLEQEDRFDYITDGGIVRVRPKPSPWMKILLRYDDDRAHVVRNFYEREGKELLSLEEALAPLVRMADSRPFYALYPLPGVSADTTECPWCKKDIANLPPMRFNTHLLGCFKTYNAKHSRQAKADETHSFGMVQSDDSNGSSTKHLLLSKEPCQARASTCRWRSCGFDFGNKPPYTAAKHMLDHIHHSSGGLCDWSDCGWAATNCLELEGHLLQAHGVFSRSTLQDEAFFCHQCRSWFTSRFAWEKHCEQHLTDLQDPFCGSIIFKGAIIFAALCPFCLGNETKTKASEKYRQLSQCSMKSHIMDHIRDYKQPFSCPHPLCKGDHEYGHETYLQHLGDVHGICLRAKKNRAMDTISQEPVLCTFEDRQEITYEEVDLTED